MVTEAIVFEKLRVDLVTITVVDLITTFDSLSILVDIYKVSLLDPFLIKIPDPFEVLGLP